MDANTKQPTAMEAGSAPAAIPTPPDPSSEKAETKGDASGSGKRKQQAIVLTILVLLLGSVGVWQYRSNSAGGNENPSSSASEERNKDNKNPNEPNRAPGNPTVQLASLSARDPFMPDISMTRLPSDPTSPANQGNTRPSNFTISGSPPPLPPMPIPQGGQLQLAPSGGNDYQPGFTPSAPETPQWEVVGVVEGPNTVAIVKDSQGNRRFVRDGDLLGDGFRVQTVRRGEVIMRGHGQSHTLKVGQSPTDSQKNAQQNEGGSPQ